MKDTDVIVVGGFLALLWYVSKHHTVNVAPINTGATATTATTNTAKAETKPVNQQAALDFGGGGGGGGINERASELSVYGNSGWDEFDILELIARSQAADDNYRNRYPVGPSVIDVSELEQ